MLIGEAPIGREEVREMGESLTLVPTKPMPARQHDRATPAPTAAATDKPFIWLVARMEKKGSEWLPDDVYNTTDHASYK
jgi:hypothetical protein